MNPKAPVLDIDFGMAQLSGNRELLLRLLNKLVEEYQGTNATLQQCFADGDWEQAKVILHTLKGVAGNLGCSALHEASRTTEHELKQTAQVPSSYADFAATLDATCEHITQLQTDDLSSSGSTSNAEATSTNPAQQALISALQAHEFIPGSQLDEWLAEMQLPEDKANEVREAIADLDYSLAESLLS